MDKIKEFYTYFQKELPTKHESDHDGFLNKALAIKYNQRKMKKLEKDFSILKKEEQEEQVEMRRLRGENKLLKQRIENLEKESANLAERLIKGQVINAQNAESIYVLKNENQKLKDKINEMNLEYETSLALRRKQMSEQSNTSNEKDLLLEKVRMLMEENDKLRETPDTQRLEEELLQVKMRDAEAQLAIKELQKTIHVLNLEYQEFLNNRNAAIYQLSSLNGASSDGGGNNGQNRIDNQAMEEELLKIKMREAESQSEKKSISLKMMQLDTEKQVAYNQIKRQDEEIRKLNAQILEMKEKELDIKMSLMEFRRQLDDKEALVKESKMTHKLQEAEDAHLIAELRQRVASLEVQIQELVTTGQLNDNAKNFNLYNGISASTDRLVDFNDDLRFILMSSNSTLNNHNQNNRTSSSLQTEKFNFLKKLNNIETENGECQSPSSPMSTPTTPSLNPVNLLSNHHHLINNDLQMNNTSASLASIPNTTILSQGESYKKVSRSHSEDAKKTDQTKLFETNNNINNNHPISENQNGNDNKEFSDDAIDDDVILNNHIKNNFQNGIENKLS